MANFLEQFRLARLAGAPIVAVRTPDPSATIAELAELAVNKDAPILQWDYVRGIRAVNEKHAAIAKMILGSDPPAAVANPTEMLIRAHRLPENSILFMLNLHRHLHDASNVQAVWNVRDVFKANSRMLVILAPDIVLPPELVQDALVLDEPLPDEAKLEAIIRGVYDGAEGVAAPKKETIEKAKAALAGLASFPAEQQCAMSIRKEGLDISQLWGRKRKTIEQTPGLSVWRGPERFADIGGCQNIKNFLLQLRDGKNPPHAIAFQDEIEKSYAGSMGDLSGVTQELLKQQLTEMADNEYTGMLFIGHPGTAKSAIAKAAGNEMGIPTIQLDIGGMKGSLVGESQANMRMGMKVVKAVSQGNCLFIATCNGIGALTPELRRRFSFGEIFFDLPTQTERELIWQIYFEKFEIPKAAQEKPMDKGWTGAEIRKCCDIASRLDITIKDASAYIVPLSISASERVTGLRKDADGRFISASTPGLYKAPEGIEDAEEPPMVVAAFIPGKRKINTTKGPSGAN